MADARRYRFTVAYDGAPWRGWQSQPCGMGVQDRIEAAIAQVTGSRATVHGAGRTDAGVHATGQVAHADIITRLAPERLIGAINAHLPETIRILACRVAPDDFHARFSASGKRYRYRIATGAALSPLERGRAWWLPGKPDLAIVAAVLSGAVGTHDFAAFSAQLPEDKSTVKTIWAIRVVRRRDGFDITFDGAGFLRRMIRLLVGSAVRVAQGKAEASWFAALLGGLERTSFAAPAEGLYLERVYYGSAVARRTERH